jgi:hypothetical protein
MARASDTKQTWRESTGLYLYTPTEVTTVLKVPVIISEVNMDSNWNPDPKRNTPFHSAWYAEKLRAFILDGNISYSLFYAFADRVNHFGMVSDDYPYKPLWHPYHVNYLIGNSLDVGDLIYESSSDDFEKVSTLAWRHETENLLLLIGKTKELTTVKVTLPIQDGTLINIKHIVTINEYESDIEEEIIFYNDPLKIKFNGYSVFLLTINS